MAGVLCCVVMLIPCVRVHRPPNTRYHQTLIVQALNDQFDVCYAMRGQARPGYQKGSSPPDGWHAVLHGHAIRGHAFALILEPQ